MTSTRDRILKSKLYKAILWITLFAMSGTSLIFTPNLFKRWGASSKPSVMSINGYDITVNSFNQKVSHETERIELFKQQLGEYADMFLKGWGLDNPREVALNALIQEALLNQVADKLRIYFSSNFVMQKLQNPMFIVHELRDIIPLSVLEQTGALNIQALSFYLSRHGMTMADFEYALEQALRRHQVINMINGSVYISKDQINNYMVQHFAPKQYAIASLSLDKFLKDLKTKPLAEEELQKFFADENKQSKRYWVPEKRSAELWAFNPESFGITIPEEEIAKYYQTNKQKYIETPVSIQVRKIVFKNTAPSSREQLEQVRQELLAAPTLFAQKAQEQSQDQKTSKNGGLMPFFKKGEQDPALERAALRLQNDGDISDIVTTAEGLIILQRVQRKPATYRSLESVKNDIQKALLKERFSTTFNADQSRIINSENPAQAMAAYATKKKGERSELKAIEYKDTPIIQRIFKTAQDHWSFLIDKDGKGIVLHVTMIEKKHEPSFSSVKTRVQEDLYNEKAVKALSDTLEAIKTAANTKDLSALKEHYGFALEKTDWVSTQEQMEALEKKGMPIMAFQALNRLNKSTTTVDANKGYVIKLVAVGTLKEGEIQQKNNEARAALYQEQKELIQRGYIASLYRNATIKSLQTIESSRESIPLEEPL